MSTKVDTDAAGVSVVTDGGESRRTLTPAVICGRTAVFVRLRGHEKAPVSCQLPGLIVPLWSNGRAPGSHPD